MALPIQTLPWLIHLSQRARGCESAPTTFPNPSTSVKTCTECAKAPFTNRVVFVRPSNSLPISCGDRSNKQLMSDDCSIRRARSRNAKLCRIEEVGLVDTPRQIRSQAICIIGGINDQRELVRA